MTIEDTKMKENEQNKILVDLVTKYREKRDPVIFSKILEETDKLLLNTVYKCIKKWPYLRRVELQDLYQTAILGLYKAISGVHIYKRKIVRKKEDKPIARIVGYVKAEIKQVYSNYNRRVLGSSVLEDKCVFEESVSKNLEHEDYMRKLNEYVKSGIVTEQDYSILVRHFADEMTYKIIGEQERLSRAAICVRVKKAIAKLRRAFKRDGIE